MYVSVVYYDARINGYIGKEYTFKTMLPLKEFQKVLVQTEDGEVKKALVMHVNLPDPPKDAPWINNIKTITKIDTE